MRDEPTTPHGVMDGEVTMTKEQAERLKRVLLHSIGDTRSCPACFHSFIPRDKAQADAWELFKQLFGDDP